MNEDRLFPKPLEQIIFEKVKFFFLPERTAVQIKNLIEGKISDRSLVCCNSGCEVCNETIYNCYMSVKAELEK